MASTISTTTSRILPEALRATYRFDGVVMGNSSLLVSMAASIHARQTATD
jgi:hypothetical protein